MSLSRLVRNCLKWLRAATRSLAAWRPPRDLHVRLHLETLEARAAAAAIAPFVDAPPAPTAVVREQGPVGGIILAPMRPAPALSSWHQDRLFGEEDSDTLRNGKDLVLFSAGVDWSVWQIDETLTDHLETLSSGKDDTWIFFAEPASETRAAVSDRVFVEPGPTFGE